MTTGWTEAIHAVVVPVNVPNIGRVGMVLIWNISDVTRATPTKLWDPRTGSFYATILVDTNISPNGTPFCSGHSFLPDGTLVVAGGDFIDPNTGQIVNVGTTNAIQFNPSPNPPVWGILGSLLDPVDPSDPNGPLAGGRWYPTNVTAKVPGQPERVFTFSGRNKLQNPIVQTNHTVERYDPGTNQWQLWSRDNLGFLNSESWYPRLHLMATGTASGQILYAGGEPEGWLYNPASIGPNDNPWTLSAGRSRLRLQGTSILLPSAENGRVMTAGGWQILFQNPPRCDVSDTAEIIDFSGQNPQWQLVSNRMSSPRSNLNAVTLPDGQVIFLGGETACSPTAGAKDCGNCMPVYTADLFNPLTSSWLTIPPPVPAQQRPRQYHSTAVLLPDGRVLLAGGDSDNCGNPPAPCQCNAPCPSGQIYRPGYLFRGPRPAITSSPATISYGTQFILNVSGPGPITTVLLIRPGAVTHGFDNEQRSVTLQFSQQGNAVTVTVPPNTDVSRYVAPSGYYLLFVVSGQGANQIPSEAQFVQLVDPTTGAFWLSRGR